MSLKTKNKPRRKGGLYYHSRTYENPFFKHRRESGAPKIARLKTIQIGWRVKIVAVFFLLFSATAVYFLFYSPYFTIKKIKVKGEGKVAPAAIEKIVWQQINSSFFILWPQKNIFLFNKDKLVKTLNSKYAFSNLEIIKKPPAEIIIEYKEKEYGLIWHEKDKYFYANREGEIITEINQQEAAQKSYPLVENQTNAEIKNRQITAGGQYLKYILLLAEKMPQYAKLPPIEKYIISQELNTVKVKFKNGPSVYFNIKTSADKQIRKLAVLKEEKIGSAFFDLTYIDLRYGDSVYYR